MTITEFLLARIAEDKAVARGSAVDDLAPGEALEYELRDEHQFETLCIPSRRVLAECEAKRRIVEGYVQADQLMQQTPGTETMAALIVGGAKAFEVVVHELAMPYADHPDYDPAWK